MRITQLSLTNFRSFSETQHIKFAPVTLLFGPNSVGKSTILMALFYLQQVIEKGQCDPQRLEPLGNKFVGGFKNLVNGRDLSKSIVIRVDYDKQSEIGSTYAKTIEALSESSTTINPPILLEDQAVSTETVGLEFTISWSKTKRTAYVERFKVWLNEQLIGETTCDDGLKNPVVSFLDLTHPLLLPSDHDDWLQDILDGDSEYLWSGWDEKLGFGERGYGHEYTDHFSDEGLISQFDQTMGGTTVFGIDTISGALPKTNQLLKTALSLDDSFTTSIINEALSEVLVSPLDNLLEYLNDSVCIGPIRCIPDSTFQANHYPRQGDWYDGTACWDVLQKPYLWRDAKVNQWLIDEDKLNIGYKLVYQTVDKESRFIEPTLTITSAEDVLALNDAVGDQLRVTISKEDLADNPCAEQSPRTSETLEAIRNQVDFHSRLYVGTEIDKVTNVGMWDINNHISVTPSDIGVGVSQLMPLVVAAHSEKISLVACEQPELHVHPRIQIAIGDLLTQCDESKQFLIETHSEHLILRMLRRVRETSESRLDDSLSGVSKNDISVVYLEVTGPSVSVKSLAIDDDGDFSKGWPDGFFEERDEELF